MRICLFTPNFLPEVGGAEYIADTIARKLTQRGHQVTVLAPKVKGTMPKLPYPVFHYHRPPKQHLWPEVLCRPLRKLHRRKHFDVVLAFYSYPNGYAAVRACRKTGIPAVLNPHGGDLYPKFHELKKPRVKNIIRYGYQHADRIVSISNWITDRLKEVTDNNLPPVDLVYNGLDLQEHDALLTAARARKQKPLIDGPFVLHMARVAPVKRQTLAVQAVAKLRHRFEQQGLTYAIAGDGADLDKVKHLIEQHNLQHIVKTLGTRTGLDKAWLLAHARLAVSTSREEAFGVVVIEAMASGLPMLGSDIGAHNELIGSHGWGQMFKSGDVDDLAKQLDAMLDMDLEPMRNTARQLRDEFSLEKMIDGYEQACQKAIDHQV